MDYHTYHTHLDPDTVEAFSGSMTTTLDAEPHVDDRLTQAYDALRLARFSPHGPAQRAKAAEAFDILGEYLVTTRNA